jgi:uncharacterized SAM-binding protein YcdF (DUF218 family)
MYDDYEFDGKDSGASTIVGVLILCAVILGGAFGLIYYLQGPFAGRQFAGHLFAPVGFFWLIFFVAAMTATFTKQRFLAVMLWLSMAGLSLAGNRTVANNLIAGLESNYRPVEVSELETLNFGFVLGGAAQVAKNRQLDLNESGERVIEAIRLYKLGKIKHLVFTGSPFLFGEDVAKAKNPPTAVDPSPTGPSPETTTSGEAGTSSGAGQTGDPTSADGEATGDEKTSGPFVPQDPPATPEAAAADARMLSPYEEAMRAWLTAQGVAAADCTFLGGRYTQEEMLRIDEFLADKPPGKHGLITSAYHMPRAVKLAFRQGLEMVAIPVDFRSGTTEDDPVFFIPKSQDLAVCTAALKEYVAGWLQ